MKYGRFDLENKEYVIETYNTPLPWINYLTNGEMFSLISNLGGGYSFYKDAKLRRLTRFTYNSPDRDDRGRLIYIDDGKDIFSPSFYPTKCELDEYRCRVGLNYTRFVSRKNDLEMELLCFIPKGDNVELSKLTLTNSSKNVKEIVLTAGVEFCLYNAVDDMSNFQRNFSTGEVEVSGNAIYNKTEYRERRNHYCFFATNEKFDSFETDRDSFVGLHGDYRLPKGVKDKHLSNKIASGWSPVAFKQIKIKLNPMETRTFVFMLGYVENKEEEKFLPNGLINKAKAEQMISKYANAINVDNAFLELKKDWDNLLSTFHIDSSDKKLDAMVNVFNQYQCMMTYHISRSASYYESGISRGMGFRDSCQDLLGFVHLRSDLARQRILDLASIMKSDGSTFHQYQPLDKKGNEDIGGGFNDDPLWIIAAVYAYLAETGDYSILEEKLPYSDIFNSSFTLLDHLDRAFKFIVNNLGPHGLPLIGHADWNDCLNLNCFSKIPGESFQTHKGNDGRVAESIFIAGMFVKYGNEYSEILKRISKDTSKVDLEVKKMKEAIYKHGFDKTHFLRAYDAFGNKVGSDENKEGQIYIEPQGMCLMAGLGQDNKMASLALDDVYNRLNTKYGICLLSPCYSTYHLELGEITSYPKGYKENGGIFSHNNPWIIIAECMNNNPERAFTYYKEITPAYIEDISDVHKTEAYVYSQMVAGKEAPNFGEAKNSWLTGTAAWSFVAVSQYMLGIRPTLDGLLIEPKIPLEYRLVRKYKGVNIHIKVSKNSHKKVLISNEMLEKKEDIYVEL